MMRAVAFAAVAAGLLLAPPLASAQDRGKVAQGMALLTSQKCTLCHAAQGVKGNAKGPLDGVGARLKESEIRQWIVDPDAMRAKTNATRTPAMKQANLSKDQVDALVAYLQTLKTPPADAAR